MLRIMLSKDHCSKSMWNVLKRARLEAETLGYHNSVKTLQFLEKHRISSLEEKKDKTCKLLERRPSPWRAPQLKYLSCELPSYLSLSMLKKYAFTLFSDYKSNP